jgi:hypothetical protein
MDSHKSNLTIREINTLKLSKPQFYWNKHAMCVRLVCVSVAVTFSHFVERVACVCVIVTMGASVNVFYHCRWMVRARTLLGMCARMLHTHLMRLIESWS